MTLVPVTVTDQFGRNVAGLNKDNFKICDGSEERSIAAFGLQDATVSIGMVFDCSRSMKDSSPNVAPVGFPVIRRAPS